MNIPQTIAKVFGNRWLQGAFVAKSIEEAISGSIGTSIDFSHDAAHYDPNTFERAGYGIGGVATAGATLVGMDLPWLRHGIMRENAMHDEAYKWKNAKGHTANYAKVGDDIRHIGPSGSPSTVIARDQAEEIMKKGSKGIISKKGAFLKNAGWRFNLGTMLGPMAIGMGMTVLAGFGGKMMDEMYQIHRKERSMQYDNRYLVNQQQDMSTLQQVGSAMDAYQNKMVSLGRIYHSR